MALSSLRQLEYLEGGEMRADKYCNHHVREGIVYTFLNSNLTNDKHFPGDMHSNPLSKHVTGTQVIVQSLFSNTTSRLDSTLEYNFSHRRLCLVN